MSYSNGDGGMSNAKPIVAPVETRNVVNRPAMPTTVV